MTNGYYNWKHIEIVRPLVAQGMTEREIVWAVKGQMDQSQAFNAMDFIAEGK